MTTVPPREPHRDPDDRVFDEKARKAAGVATIIAVVAGLIGLVALIFAIVHTSQDFAPANCDPTTDYVCKPETRTETTTTQVPSTSLSPTEVPVPTSSPSEVVTTTVAP